MTTPQYPRFLARHQLFLAAALMVFQMSCTSALDARPMLTGVNLAGAEFDHGTFWPTTQEIDYFVGKGMNTIRVPFLWERMQPSLSSSFDASQQADLVAVVNYATGLGVRVIIDPHNYARYNGNLIGSASVPNSAFDDFWGRLANLFKGNDRVIFGLMNEPHSMSTEQWLTSANSAIAAIRATGATNLVLVPGNAWTGAHSWLQNWYGTPNGTVMASVMDSANHFAYELHQYFDSDFSGQSPTCVSGTGSQQLQAVTTWLRERGAKGFLGEFAGADNGVCRLAIEDALSFIDDNTDVWLGWTWWAAGPEWGEYIFTLEPTNNFMTDRPQMVWLEPHLNVGPLFMDGFESGDTSMW